MAESEKPGAGIVVSRRWRIAASFFIIGHLWAVCGRPLDFATQGPEGTSPASGLFYAPVRGYSEFAYLNHGYAFFAPEPGPSHLIRATIHHRDGEREIRMVPDRARQWPRLLYHRYFMLSEFLHNLYQPPEVPEELAADSWLARDWQLRRQRYEMVRESMRHHLMVEFNAESVTLQRVEHQVPPHAEFLERRPRLDAPESYLDLLDEPEESLPVPRFGAPVTPGGFSPRGNFPGEGQ